MKEIKETIDEKFVTRFSNSGFNPKEISNNNYSSVKKGCCGKLP